MLAGDADPLAARPQALVAAIAGARLEQVSGDHPGGVGDPRVARALVELLAEDL